MMPPFRGKWRLPMCLCGVSLSLAVLYLCTHKALGQIPPSYGYGGGGGQGGTVEFTASMYTIYEGDTAVIGVVGYPAVNQPASVNYATSDGTGQAGVDYTSTSGTIILTYGPTQWAPHAFEVPTMNDPNNTGYVTVNLTLSSPYGVTLGDPSTATLYIINPSGSCPNN